MRIEQKLLNLQNVSLCLLHALAHKFVGLLPEGFVYRF